jgi:hypothetical protein
MTPKQAARLMDRGVVTGVPGTRKPQVRRESLGPYHSRCHACRQEFNTAASEDRHVDETLHARYEVML